MKWLILGSFMLLWCTACAVSEPEETTTVEMTEKVVTITESFTTLLSETTATTAVSNEFLQVYTSTELLTWKNPDDPQHVALLAMFNDFKDTGQYVDTVEYLFKITELGAGRYQAIDLYENYADQQVFLMRYRYDTITQTAKLISE